MKSHYNKNLEYLLSNNPEKVLSSYGVRIRKLFNPLFRKLLPLTTKNKLIVEQKAIFPKGKKIIFAATHGFRDDIALTFKTINAHTYLLYASIPDFFYSIDGYALNIPGVILMDRKDALSRQASIPKIERAIDLGSKVALCPEGVWNKSPNLLVLKLYPGVYDVALQKETLVQPIATIIEENKCYSKAGDAYDMTRMSVLEYLEVMSRIGQNIEKMIDLIISPDSKLKELKEQLQGIMEEYYCSMLNIYDKELKSFDTEKTSICYLQEQLVLEIEYYQSLLQQLYKEYCFISVDENEIREKEEYCYNSHIISSIRKRVLHLLKTTMNMKRKVALELLRDKMAALKLELMEKHSQAKRSDFSMYDPISTYWDEYIDKLIETANGLYDYEIEDTAHFVDKDEFDQDEVFAPINSINQRIAINSKRLVLKSRNNNRL